MRIGRYSVWEIFWWTVAAGLIVWVMFVLTGCAGNRIFGVPDDALLSKYTAGRQYYVAEFCLECGCTAEQSKGLPPGYQTKMPTSQAIGENKSPECKRWGVALDKLQDEVELATKVLTQGPMPTQERDELAATWKEVCKKGIQ